MITIEFKDFEEMKRFAREILGVQEEKKEAVKPEPVSTSASPVMPVPVQQSAPAAQSAPMQAQTAVPVQTPTLQAPSAPVAQTVQQPAPVSVPTSSASYTQDDLARAAMTLMDAGRQNELLNLLAQFGVTSLPDLPQAQYGAFATALRGLGARI